MVHAPILSYAPSNHQKTLCKERLPANQVSLGAVPGTDVVVSTLNRPHLATLYEEQQLGTGLLKLCPGKHRNPALVGEVSS